MILQGSLLQTLALKAVCSWIFLLFPKRSDGAGEGCGGQVLTGVSEGAGAVQSGQKEPQRRPYESLQVPDRRVWPGGVRVFLTSNK